MRILVTGSLGTLGRPLVAELRERGHQVWGTDLTHHGDPQYIRADVANLAQLQKAFAAARPDAVYHLAAEFGRLNGEQYTEQLWRSAMVGDSQRAGAVGGRWGAPSLRELLGDLR